MFEGYPSPLVNENSMLWYAAADAVYDRAREALTRHVFQVGEFIAEEWDLSRPLWETLIVENYKDDEGVCAVIAKGYNLYSKCALAEKRLIPHALADTTLYPMGKVRCTARTNC